MCNMFYHCLNLIKLDIPLFEYNKNKNISCMLYGCHKLKEINLSFFNIIIENNICREIFSCDNFKLVKLSEDENKIVKFKRE